MDVPIALALASLILQTPVAAPVAVEYKGLVYSCPSTWMVTDNDDSRVLVAPNPKEDEVLLVALTGTLPAVETPEKDLKAVKEGAEKDEKILSRGKLRTVKQGGFTYLFEDAKVQDPDLGVHNRTYELVTDGKTDAVAMMLAKGDDTYRRNKDDVLKIMMSIHPGTLAKAQPAVPGKLLFRNAPGSYAGDPASLYSGVGKDIPDAKIVDGKPQGLWWIDGPEPDVKPSPLAEFYGSKRVYDTVFWPEGVLVRSYHPGGVRSVDLQDRTAANPSTIGTWNLNEGKMTLNLGAHLVTGEMTLGKGDATFQIGETRYHPCVPLESAALAGTWKGGHLQYEFKPDGTCEFSNSAIDHGAKQKGTWILDGYLLQISTGDGKVVLTFKAYKYDEGSIVINNGVFSQK